MAQVLATEGGETAIEIGDWTITPGIRYEMISEFVIVARLVVSRLAKP